jgi:hypothetical protein
MRVLPFLSVLPALALVGCVSVSTGTKPRLLVSTAPSPDLGRVGVEFASSRTSFDIAQLPESKGHATARMAVSGAISPAVLSLTNGGGGYGLVLAALVTPVTTLGGGVYGAIEGVSGDQLTAATTEIETAKNALSLPDQLKAALAGKLSALPGAGAPASTASADTTLTLYVLRCGLHGDKSINPLLRLCVRLQAELLRTRTSAEAGRAYVNFESSPLVYTDWAGSHALALHREWDAAIASVAQQLADWINGVQLPPPIPVAR